MKRIEIINMFLTLGKVRVNGITDREVKSALISAHLKLYKFGKEYNEFLAGLSERFTAEEKDAANEALDKFLNEEVDVTLEKIGRGAFAKAIADTDTDIILGELNLLEPLFKED